MTVYVKDASKSVLSGLSKMNAARGNILDGGYDINWTGACYL